MKSRPSVSCTKVKTSPPALQPKQWYIFFSASTLNDAVRSSWNGQRPM
jgi:hypothetical protein